MLMYTKGAKFVAERAVGYQSFFLPNPMVISGLSGISTGNLLVLMLSSWVPDTTNRSWNSVSDNGVGGSWNKDTSVPRQLSTNYPMVAIFSMIVGATPPTTVSAYVYPTTANPNIRGVYRILEFSGIASSNWLASTSLGVADARVLSDGAMSVTHDASAIPKAWYLQVASWGLGLNTNINSNPRPDATFQLLGGVNGSNATANIGVYRNVHAGGSGSSLTAGVVAAVPQDSYGSGLSVLYNLA